MKTFLQQIRHNELLFTLISILHVIIHHYKFTSKFIFLGAKEVPITQMSNLWAVTNPFSDKLNQTFIETESATRTPPSMARKTTSPPVKLKPVSQLSGSHRKTST